MKDWPWYSYLVVAVVLFAIVFLIVLKPRNEKISNTKEERIRIENEVNQLKSKKRQLNKIEARQSDTATITANTTIKTYIFRETMPSKKRKSPGK